MTPGNVNDGRAGPSALPEVVGEVFADSAYRGPHFASAVRSRGGTPRVVAPHVWAHKDEDGEALLRSINGPIKRAKAGLQIRLTMIAYNLRRTMTILKERCA